MNAMSAELEARFREATALRDSGNLRAAKPILEQLSAEHPGVLPIWLVLGAI